MKVKRPVTKHCLYTNQVDFESEKHNYMYVDGNFVLIRALN